MAGPFLWVGLLRVAGARHVLMQRMRRCNVCAGTRYAQGYLQTGRVFPGLSAFGLQNLFGRGVDAPRAGGKGQRRGKMRQLAERVRARMPRAMLSWARRLHQSG